MTLCRVLLVVSLALGLGGLPGPGWAAPPPAATAVVTPAPIAIRAPAPLPVPYQALLQVQAAERAEACRGLGTELDRAITDSTDRVFDEIAHELDTYVAWMFDWRESSTRYFDIIRYSTVELLSTLAAFRFDFDLSVVEDYVIAQIEQKFFELAVAPVAAGRRFRTTVSDLETWLADRLTTLDCRQARDQAALLDPTGSDRALAAALAATCSTAGAGAGAIDPARRVARIAPPPDIKQFLEASRDDVRATLIRTTRPVVSRGIGIVLRVASGITVGRIASQVADVADIGLAGYAPGVIAGIAVAITVTWSLDYLLSGLDEWLHRDQYRGLVLAYLNGVEAQLRDDWRRRADRRLLPACARVRRLR